MNLSTYLKEIQKELRVTTFPTQQVVINFTLFVILFTAAMAVYLGALDLGFGEGILKAINHFSNAPIAELNNVVATTTNATTTATGIVNLVPTSATSVPTNILLK